MCHLIWQIKNEWKLGLDNIFILKISVLKVEDFAIFTLEKNECEK